MIFCTRKCDEVQQDYSQSYIADTLTRNSYHYSTFPITYYCSTIFSQLAHMSCLQSIVLSQQLEENICNIQLLFKYKNSLQLYIASWLKSLLWATLFTTTKPLTLVVCVVVLKPSLNLDFEVDVETFVYMIWHLVDFQAFLWI